MNRPTTSTRTGLSLSPGSGLLQEVFELRFTKLSEKYIKQKVGGATGGNTAASWNLATNKAT